MNNGFQQNQHETYSTLTANISFHINNENDADVDW